MNDKAREAFEAWGYAEGLQAKNDDRGMDYPLGRALEKAWAAALQWAASQQAAPEGWRLVPVEPTDEMLDKGAMEIAMNRQRVQTAESGAHHVYRAMLAAAPAQQAAEGWRPIETAPKDGTVVLLRSKKGRVADGMWVAANSNVGYWAWSLVKQEPTHWQHLPAAPTAQGERDEQ